MYHVSLCNIHISARAIFFSTHADAARRKGAMQKRLGKFQVLSFMEKWWYFQWKIPWGKSYSMFFVKAMACHGHTFFHEK